MYFYAYLVFVDLGRITDSIGVYVTVFEFYTVGNALHIFFGYIFIEPYVVNLFLDEFRVRQFRGQIAVVGKLEHSGGITVEASDGINPFGTCIFYDVHDRKTALRVVRRRYAVFRLVEQNINFMFGQYDFIVVSNDIVAGYFGALFCDDFTVDLDFSVLDKLIGFST